MLTQGTGGLVADEEMRAPGARSGRGGACGRLAGLSCEYRPIATSPRPFCGSETSYIATPACPVARPYWWRSVNPIMCNVTVVSYGNCNAVASATGSGRSEFHDLAVMRSREDASLGDCGTISFIRDAADQTEPFRPAPPDAVGYRTAASAHPGIRPALLKAAIGSRAPRAWLATPASSSKGHQARPRVGGMSPPIPTPRPPAICTASSPRGPGSAYRFVCAPASVCRRPPRRSSCD